MRDRRFEPRHSADQLAELCWGASGDVAVCSGMIRNVSRSGAQIRLTRPVRVGTTIQIKKQDRDVRAKVVACTRAGPEYVLGVEFYPEFEGVLRSKPLS